MAAKDYFSHHSKTYATFRPTYPDALYKFVYSHLNENEKAWDCATGNGQVAQELSRHFKKVYATDISQQQIDHGYQAANIIYSVSPAEQTSFPDQEFDLVTVGQALHWFELDKFYSEVRRVSKPSGLLAVWGYALLSINPEIDRHFMHFYNDVVGPYWDSARKLVEDEYRTIVFPFDEIAGPRFSIDVEWNRDQFAGYLSSWSATQKFIKSKNLDPVPDFINSMKTLWDDQERKRVSFPVFLRLGRVR